MRRVARLLGITLRNVRDGIPPPGAPLRIECRRCGRPDRFDAQLLDSQFRCRYCGRYYTCIGGAPTPTGRSLVHEERVAVTRAAFD